MLGTDVRYVKKELGWLTVGDQRGGDARIDVTRPEAKLNRMSSKAIQLCCPQGTPVDSIEGVHRCAARMGR